MLMRSTSISKCTWAIKIWSSNSLAPESDRRSLTAWESSGVAVESSVSSCRDLITAPKMDSGQKRLLELGYKQELKRHLSLFSNFAISFSILSVMAGITTTFNTGLAYGGIISMTWGWLITGFFTLIVGLSMAEICSAFPTCGGLYFWSAQLAGVKWSPFASWITGWYNVVGQWAATCGVCFSLTQILQVIVLLSTGGANGGGYILSKYALIGLQAVILLSLGLLNCLPVQYFAYVSSLSMFWNALGVVLLTILIPMVAVERQTTTYIFTSFYKPEGLGISSSPYIFFLGLLMSQYSLAGFDASAHMTEETKSSDKFGAYGILTAISISIVVGWGYILALAYTVMDPSSLLDPANDAGGYAVAQLFYTIFRDRFGNGIGGIVCLGINAVAIYLGALACVTSNSRMVYAFSRDGALPFSHVWHKVNKYDVPINAVWLSCFIAFIMVLPSIGSLVAFQAMVSIAVVGLYIAYGLPILFRVTLARHTFARGPVKFGGQFCSLFIGWIAVLWVITITVLFCLPVRYPVDVQSLNYTPVAVGGVFVLTISYWLLSARKWFKGPQMNLKVWHELY